MKLDAAWLDSLSALSVNISAAWFAVVFIAPAFSRPLTPLGKILLLNDLIMGIVFLMVAVRLKRESL